MVSLCLLWEQNFWEFKREDPMSNLTELNKAREIFEKHMLLKGLPYNWDGKRYDRVNVQTKWKYFYLGFVSNSKE